LLAALLAALLGFEAAEAAAEVEATAADFPRNALFGCNAELGATVLAS